MFRAVVMAAAMAGCTFAGMQAASGLQLRRETIRLFLHAFRQISMRMEYTMEPFVCLVRHCMNEETQSIFEGFLQRLDAQPNMGAAWRDAMCEAQEHDRRFACLQPEELRALEEYMDCLQGVGYNAQKRSASLLLARLEEIAAEADEVYGRKGRMYRSMGMLSGIAVAILLF